MGAQVQDAKAIRALRDELRTLTARLGETSDETGDEEVAGGEDFDYALAVADALDWVLGDSEWTVAEGEDGAIEVADTQGIFDDLRERYRDAEAALPEPAE
jgi:hypothetical protein